MLERMAEFFERRLDGYDAHMYEIEGAREFYPVTASLLPQTAGAEVLDLGCGTGLELEHYFAYNPSAHITGIDLSAGMLNALREKFPGKALDLRQGDYFDLSLGENCFDAAVSVESLHHFTQAEKIALYAKVRNALKPGGFFILTDYFAPTDEEEAAFRAERDALAGGKSGIFHYDTPLTVFHEVQTLQHGGFTSVEILQSWGATTLLRAKR